MATGLSKRQLEIFRFPYYPQFDYLICDGAIRSGKTICCITSFILWSMDGFNRCNFGICGKTVASAIRNIIKPMLAIQFLTSRFKFRFIKSENLVIVADTVKGKENLYYIFGGKDESSYQLIQGITLAGILLDEVALMPQSFVDQAIARCSVYGSKVYFNCNPASPNHWFFKEWILKRKEKRIYYLHFTMQDNPSLTPDIIARYEAAYFGVFYDRYIRGWWVVAEGLIYPVFANRKEEYIVDTYPDKREWLMIVNGIDFGGTKSSDAFVTVGITRCFRNVYVLESKKIGYNGIQPITSDQLNSMFVEYVGMVYKKYGQVSRTFCDNAEPKLISSLKLECAKQKVMTNIENAIKDEILERIRCVSTLINLHRIKILSHNKDFIRAMEEAVWDDKHSTPGKDVRLDDGTFCVDLHDAFEYCIERYIKNIYAA